MLILPLCQPGEPGTSSWRPSTWLLHTSLVPIGDGPGIGPEKGKGGSLGRPAWEGSSELQTGSYETLSSNHEFMVNRNPFLRQLKEGKGIWPWVVGSGQH